MDFGRGISTVNGAKKIKCNTSAFFAEFTFIHFKKTPIFSSKKRHNFVLQLNAKF